MSKKRLAEAAAKIRAISERLKKMQELTARTYSVLEVRRWQGVPTKTDKPN